MHIHFFPAFWLLHLIALDLFAARARAAVAGELSGPLYEATSAAFWLQQNIPHQGHPLGDSLKPLQCLPQLWGPSPPTWLGDGEQQGLLGLSLHHE